MLYLQENLEVLNLILYNSNNLRINTNPVFSNHAGNCIGYLVLFALLQWIVGSSVQKSTRYAHTINNGKEGPLCTFFRCSQAIFSFLPTNND
ncbi:hypothetical protein EGR_09749 [Echinococcus granulosus]|uniref:Uncharacterized protein n=1 Tax=Echinococcus granulosus TaxID=6210 RepID=W6U2U5_ECHGR|nr:hypothetical protein EGR_09749 [Echinococcus granulosus]EUB55403.1 hypothetical protein EGR_09749 [Echinococcus granulosus]